MSLAYRACALVEFYFIQLLLKNPRIEVHNKKKNCRYILRSFVPCGDDMLMICC
jgi:hypothetical protein